MSRNRTSADRCADCALSRKKEDRCNHAPQGSYMEFEECLDTETPFWCHGANEAQVCRGWLAIMEKRWAREGWDIRNPRQGASGPKP